LKIITVVIKAENDIILARQRAKQISVFVGLSFIDQTRFVTAVSEITRNAIMYAKGGKIEFSIIDKEGVQLLQAAVSDKGNKDLIVSLENGHASSNGMGVGIKGTKSMMDYFFIERLHSGGNVVTFGKKIPKFIKMDSIDYWLNEIAKEKPTSFLEELQLQNQVLMKTLDRLEEREQELKLKLEETEKLNIELQSANRDLKDFAYIVSHDLKAPLRGISSLAGWLATDFGNNLGDEGNKMIEMLIGRIQRMNSLIDGILQYSRVGRVQEDKVLVEVQELIDNIIQMIKPPANIIISTDNKLPIILMEETRVTQVFQNLIENAIKYMDKENGFITIGNTDLGNKWQFYISDNGPGIDEKYREKVFKIFQTLNPRDKVEGTGIGLTIVKKIIELYEGKIWIESNVGQGTTVKFTLPKNIA
jgi:signal transduction histidine kinase